jgi:hypothetical protein
MSSPHLQCCPLGEKSFDLHLRLAGEDILLDLEGREDVDCCYPTNTMVEQNFRQLEHKIAELEKGVLEREKKLVAFEKKIADVDMMAASIKELKEDVAKSSAAPKGVGEILKHLIRQN